MKLVQKISLILLLSLALFSGCENSTEQPAVTVIASGHPSWPPIMYQQNDLIVGAGPEIVTKIFAELGLNVSVKYLGDWDVVQSKARSGEVDVLVAAYKTSERESYLMYSEKYTDDPLSVFVKKDKSFPFANWNDLIGKKGLVTKGDSYGQLFDQFIADNLDVDTVDLVSEAFTRLETEQADYFVYAYYSGWDYMTKNNVKANFEILPKPVKFEGFYLAISKKSPYVAQMPKINTILKRMVEDGTIQQIIDKYK